VANTEVLQMPIDVAMQLLIIGVAIPTWPNKLTQT